MTNLGTYVILKLEARQREIITLTGTSGTANVAAVGGVTKLATFTTDLTTSAKNFVASHAAAYLAAGVVVTNSGAKLVFEPTLLNVAITAPTIANASGTLSGTVAHVNPNNGKLFMIGETSSSFKSAQTMVEISNKLSPLYAKFKGARINQTANVTSLASTDTATTEYGHEIALACQNQNVPVDFLITEYDANGAVVSGALNISGTTCLSNVSEDIADNSKLTFTLDLQITDATIVGINA